MILRPRTLGLTGAALVAFALLVCGTALLYVRLAPKTYAASTKVMIRPKSPQVAPVMFDDLPLDQFKHDRNLIIYAQVKNSSVFEIRTSAPEPTAAAKLANQRTRELEAAVRSQSNAEISIIEEAVPNPTPVSPMSRKILMLLGLAALNAGFIGAMFLLTGFLKRRRSVAQQSLPHPVA